MIGTAKTPRCFRDEPCPIPYTSQANAWMDREVYSHWWRDIFLPTVRDYTTEPVALLMDNCSGHDATLDDPMGQVKVLFLPPKSSPWSQPLDQGIVNFNR